MRSLKVAAKGGGGLPEGLAHQKFFTGALLGFIG